MLRIRERRAFAMVEAILMLTILTLMATMAATAFRGVFGSAGHVKDAEQAAMQLDKQARDLAAFNNSDPAASMSEAQSYLNSDVTVTPGASGNHFVVTTADGAATCLITGANANTPGRTVMTGSNGLDSGSGTC